MSRKKTLISELNLKTIGGRIAYIRLTNGLSQAQFSKKTGLSSGNISGLENNSYEPSARALVKIVELFNVSSDWILFGDSNQDAQESSKENSNNLTHVVIEHQDMIPKFLRPRKAKEFNEFLLEIEKHNPKGYDNLYELAKSLYETTPGASSGVKKNRMAQKPSTKKRANGE